MSWVRRVSYFIPRRCTLWTVLVAQSCLTLCNRRLLCPCDFPGKNTGVGNHSLPGGSSQPRDWTWVSHTARFFTVWATRAQLEESLKHKLGMTFMILLPSFVSLSKTPRNWVQTLQSIPQSRRLWLHCHQLRFAPRGKEATLLLITLLLLYSSPPCCSPTSWGGAHQQKTQGLTATLPEPPAHQTRNNATRQAYLDMHASLPIKAKKYFRRIYKAENTL